MPFFWEVAGRAWVLFLVAIGTTGLGFFASSVLQFFVVELVTLLVLWWFRGADAMRSRRTENLLIGAVAYVIAVLTIYAPIYFRQTLKVDGEIRDEADTHIPPGTSRYPALPDFAYELSPASITVSLVPQNGFSVDLGGPYKLDDKKQYLLTFSNLSHAIKAAEIEVKFPYPVEARKIVRVSAIREVTFEPSRPLINLLGAQLENGGCLGRWSYHLHVADAARGGVTEVSLILNGYSHTHPTAESAIAQGNGYIAGKFLYSYRGSAVISDYYATLEPAQDMMIKTSQPQGRLPQGWKPSFGFTVLMGPCIPDSSILTLQ